jgi:uncharacterized protein YndB with AHSA1/START domain
VSPERVFNAYADPKIHRQWHVPGEGWEFAEYEHDLRAGGREFSRFGPPGDARYWEEGRFEVVVPNRRIVSAGTMHSGTTPSSTTLCTVEIVAEGAGTRLILTDQSVFYGEGETPADRREGWSEILDKLAKALA